MESKRVCKPEWLRKKIIPSVHREMEGLLNNGQLKTVCEEAMCPNISECFSHKQATFMILGNICTRACTYCAVGKGKPLIPDLNEPKNVANAVKELGLRHVVVTSSTRDDLSDGGAEHFCKTVKAIKNIDTKKIVVELLIPDMKENKHALSLIANSGAEIIGHNLETVPRLYAVRKGATYERSLHVLKRLVSLNPKIATKSGIMLGLGENENEVLSLMQDLLDVNCYYLSIGQYLSPSQNHAKVIEYVKPEQFERLKKIGMGMGFKYIKSSPYTRSSYMAHEYLGE